MDQSQWSAEMGETWKALEAFQVDEPKVVFSFSARLARENGWTANQASRAIAEYKRFLFLARHAGHSVTPSIVIDQVWHLHLVYTRSYWKELCGDVLGRQLHHHPTTGGLAESGKFEAQYEQTLTSYRRLFGEAPPQDIWPSKELCFRPKKSRWVDVSKLWLIPKPSWVSRIRLRPVAAISIASLSIVTLASCTDLNVFNYTGIEFLKFYVSAFALAFLISLVVGSIFRSRVARGESSGPLTDPYEIAFLAGGGRRMVDAVFTALFTRGAIVTYEEGNGAGRMGKVEAPLDETDWHPFESLCLTAFPESGTAKVGSLRKALIPLTEAMQGSMTDLGLILSSAQLVKLRLTVAFPLLLVMISGAIKIVVGIDRNKPVLFLVILLFLSLIALIFRIALVGKRTLEGATVWKEIRSQGRVKPIIERDGKWALDPNNAALMVAIGGAATLNTSSFKSLHQTIYRPGADTGAGCGAGGCGGDGGGCGDGCGGGGCGGCGGD